MTVINKRFHNLHSKYQTYFVCFLLFQQKQQKIIISDSNFPSWTKIKEKKLIRMIFRFCFAFFYHLGFIGLIINICLLCLLLFILMNFLYSFFSKTMFIFLFFSKISIINTCIKIFLKVNKHKLIYNYLLRLNMDF